ncbi:MAG: peptide deformylase [Thermodesulfobacteriota bacterium]|nr:peptide deformylase [Thermodesulfobacteriota bacterium]
MSVRDIIIYPNNVLQRKAEEIEDIGSDIISLAKDMAATMYAAPGVGLAAPQVGQSVRLILVDETGKRDSGKLITLINPVILEKEGEDIAEEMCLSVPEFATDIGRAAHIFIKGIDLEGRDVKLEVEGFLARIIQHEIDHLDGTVIADHASSLKRSIYLRKRKKGKI